MVRMVHQRIAVWDVLETIQKYAAEAARILFMKPALRYTQPRPQPQPQQPVRPRKRQPLIQVTKS